jgi:hypothetical protein
MNNECGGVGGMRNGKEKPQYSRENPHQCHFIHHNIHMT